MSAQFLHGVEKCLGFFGQPEAEDVYLAIFAAHAEFAASHDLDARLVAHGYGLVETRHGVVVGDGDGGKTRLCGLADEVGRAVATVGCRGMGVKVDEAGRHVSPVCRPEAGFRAML